MFGGEESAAFVSGYAQYLFNEGRYSDTLKFSEKLFFDDAAGLKFLPYEEQALVRYISAVSLLKKGQEGQIRREGKYFEEQQEEIESETESSVSSDDDTSSFDDLLIFGERRRSMLSDNKFRDRRSLLKRSRLYDDENLSDSESSDEDDSGIAAFEEYGEDYASFADCINAANVLKPLFENVLEDRRLLDFLPDDKIKTLAEYFYAKSVYNTKGVSEIFQVAKDLKSDENLRNLSYKIRLNIHEIVQDSEIFKENRAG